MLSGLSCYQGYEAIMFHETVKGIATLLLYMKEKSHLGRSVLYCYKSSICR